jgi:preprotein translocase subunit SecE
MFNKIKEFFQEVKLEFKKVVFPTRKEVIGSTWVVIVTVLICAVFLGIVDMALGKAMTSVFFNK